MAWDILQENPLSGACVGGGRKGKTFSKIRHVTRLRTCGVPNPLMNGAQSVRALIVLLASSLVNESNSLIDLDELGETPPTTLRCQVSQGTATDSSDIVSTSNRAWDLALRWYNPIRRPHSTTNAGK